MGKIEAFYFDDGEESGEAIFNRFAAKHAHLFPEEMDADEAEQKLEYTPIFQEFCTLFEQHIESKI